MKNYNPSIHTIYDTAKVGRTVTLAFNDKQGTPINFTVLISPHYVSYTELGKDSFNRFTNNKRQQYLMEVANAYLGIRYGKA
jgi:hypothetical protein